MTPRTESPAIELSRAFLRAEMDFLTAERLMLETREQRLQHLSAFLDELIGEITALPATNGHANGAAVAEPPPAPAASIALPAAPPASVPAPAPEETPAPARPHKRELVGLTDPLSRADKPGRWRASPPVPPGYRMKRGEGMERMLAAMPGTVREIADRSKVKVPVVQEFCGRMFREGKIRRVGTARSPLVGTKGDHGVHSQTGGRRVYVYSRKD